MNNDEPIKVMTVVSKKPLKATVTMEPKPVKNKNKHLTLFLAAAAVVVTIGGAKMILPKDNVGVEQEVVNRSAIESVIDANIRSKENDASYNYDVDKIAQHILYEYYPNFDVATEMTMDYVADKTYMPNFEMRYSDAVNDQLEELEKQQKEIQERANLMSYKAANSKYLEDQRLHNEEYKMLEMQKAELARIEEAIKSSDYNNSKGINR